MVSSRVSWLLVSCVCCAEALVPGMVRTSRPVVCARAASPLAEERSPLARLGGLNPFGKKKAGPLTSGLDAVLKDAPLAFKMAGQLLKPLAGILETAIAESQGDANERIDCPERRAYDPTLALCGATIWPPPCPPPCPRASADLSNCPNL